MIEKIMDTEFGTYFSVPVTLREVESLEVRIDGVSGFSHRIPLDSTFGIDDNEHGELLDDPNILRIVFGVEYNPDTNSVGESFVLECYSKRLTSEAKWESCVDYRALAHSSGNIERHNWHSVRNALGNLALSKESVSDVLRSARQQLDDLATEVAQQQES